MSQVKKYNTFLRSPLGSILISDLQDQIGDYVFDYERLEAEHIVNMWLNSFLGRKPSFYSIHLDGIDEINLLLNSDNISDKNKGELYLNILLNKIAGSQIQYIDSLSFSNSKTLLDILELRKTKYEDLSSNVKSLLSNISYTVATKYKEDAKYNVPMGYNIYHELANRLSAIWYKIKYDVYKVGGENNYVLFLFPENYNDDIIELYNDEHEEELEKIFSKYNL